MDRTPDLERMTRLTRRYARHGRGLPGLSLALGSLTLFGLLLAAASVQNLPLASPAGQRGIFSLCIALLLAGWILLKEWLRDRLYLSMGLVELQEAGFEKILNRLSAAGIAALALSYPVRMLAAAPEPLSSSSLVQVQLGLAACLLLPWLTLRVIRGVQENLFWAFLCFWALDLSWGPVYLGLRSGSAPLFGSLFLALLPLVCLAGLAAGLVQHLGFLRLARELRSHGAQDA